MEYSQFESVRKKQIAHAGNDGNARPPRRFRTSPRLGWVHRYYPHDIFRKKERNGHKMKAYRKENPVCEVCLEVASQHSHHQL